MAYARGVSNFLTLVSNPASLRDICDAVIDGKSLPEQARELGVRYSDIALWIAADAERAALYERALALSGDRLAFEALDIADDLEIEPQHKRLQISTRLQVAARWFPARYSEKLPPPPPPAIEGKFTIEYASPPEGWGRAALPVGPDDEPTEVTL